MQANQLRLQDPLHRLLELQSPPQLQDLPRSEKVRQALVRVALRKDPLRALHLSLEPKPVRRDLLALGEGISSDLFHWMVHLKAPFQFQMVTPTTSEHIGLEFIDLFVDEVVYMKKSKKEKKNNEKTKKLKRKESKKEKKNNKKTKKT